nr:MAG TPA: hypothetical protein [Caudoviricetes sp.]
MFERRSNELLYIKGEIGDISEVLLQIVLHDSFLTIKIVKQTDLCK